jgi:Ca2+/H+ antiporter, TMEM165/GDT1 family
MLKFSVGVLLSAFGVFWLGEGLGWPWPGEDLAIPGIIAGFLLAALGAVHLCRTKPLPAARVTSITRSRP